MSGPDMKLRHRTMALNTEMMKSYNKKYLKTCETHPNSFAMSLEPVKPGFVPSFRCTPAAKNRSSPGFACIWELECCSFTDQFSSLATDDLV